MPITVTSRTDESQFHPPSQMMNPDQQIMVEIGFAAHRAGSEALDNNEEIFRGYHLAGGGKGSIGGMNSGGGPILERTFTCEGNPCCIPFDILTFCHCFTGSACCGCRPTLYDRCAPNLFTDKLVESPRSCCHCCDDWSGDRFRSKEADPTPSSYKKC